ncbi:threonine synthase [Candidatus Ishikawella capsulata]|uniref:Threonine synthase n=1 Tax=Candidatus Ishikawaella capsulata Mpkobe TaxID=476281 RepID=C5WCV7_9ENTR|nr:threonine synthase [Candidatus Ishikawaella capsulata]BAH83163.1 threonine synthase [Candidatus Ishikawaella capsulata Mpkobe]
MKFYNLKNHNEQLSFSQAVKVGLGSQQGLFFPLHLPEFELRDIDMMLEMDFLNRSSKILSVYTGNEIKPNNMRMLLKKAFSFPAIVKPVKENISCLELFHGPTLAFKDFGARFMASVLAYLNNNCATVLIATSGDTGAAVAHAFYGMHNIRVVILYPQGKISSLQEKLFCTLGKNIDTIAIKGDFDSCQTLVKQAFDDKLLREKINLNSANSINISRLLAQICYYFEGVAQLPKEKRNQLVISVPSGNFGNLTAGLLAKSLGLPIKRFIFSTNSNDTVPRFLSTGKWLPKATVATLSNAMDISNPNNWVRIEELFRRKTWSLSELSYSSVSDKMTNSTLMEMADIGYISEPHAATAYYALINNLKKEEYGLFIGTAHPAKFQDRIEPIVGKQLNPPEQLEKRKNLPLLSYTMSANFDLLKNFLLKQDQ